MISDVNQPAKEWIADAVQELKKKLQNGEDPSLELNLFGAKFEFRLNDLPGHFERGKVNES